MNYIDWLILTRTITNNIVAAVIVSIAYIIYSGSNSKLAKPLLIMFASTAIESIFVSISLYLPEAYKHELAILGKLLQFAGKIYFLVVLISHNGSLKKETDAI